MHIYIREVEILQTITFERKYFNIMNSSNFFSSEFEQMKSCIYSVKTANVGMELQWFR